MSQTDPTSPRYYFLGDVDPGLPFDLLSLAPTLPDMLQVADDELKEFLKKAGIGVFVDPKAVVETDKINYEKGPVYIGSGTHIHTGVLIDGPVYIGRDCSVRHGAQLRAGTILGNRCVVGHSAEIKASICMAGAKMQSGVFVGNSILGIGARLGSGTILANRRFDQTPVPLGSGDVKIPTDIEFFGAVLGDYARLGANVVTAPGTLVGPYTWVSSLVSLYGFVPRAKLVMLKQELEYRDKEEVKLRSGEGEYEHR